MYHFCVNAHVTSWNASGITTGRVMVSIIIQNGPEIIDVLYKMITVRYNTLSASTFHHVTT
ncbi:hypothetical protein [Salinicoccus sesuvii]|uniref:hypothetical protein n=1 Tax=Salinicoccus sesuvii TaxID=868281 RepID=UPI0036D35A11